jgi:hypothetical protein
MAAGRSVIITREPFDMFSIKMESRETAVPWNFVVRVTVTSWAIVLNDKMMK